MADRTSLTPKSPVGAYGSYSTANVADITMAAADASNKNQFSSGGNDLVIVHNSGVSTRTVTINSVVDPYGRTGDITAYSLAAGDYAVFGPFKQAGWMQTTGKIHIEASHADVLIGVVALP